MPRHHLVPQMMLRRFADERQRLVMVQRDSPHRVIPSTVNNACNEVGYYALPTEDVEAGYREGHDPELVEKTLSEIESECAPMLERLVRGALVPPPDWERYRVTQLAALQIARGWQFRQEISEMMTVFARQHLEGRRDMDKRIAAFSRRRGESVTDEAISGFRDRVLHGGWSMRMSDAHAVQQSLRYARNVLEPMLWQRRWKLLRFDCPSLLTSDAPVAPWTPGEDVPALASARAIYWPLDRCTALAFINAPKDVVATATAARARQINGVVADGASRWIFHHPDDQPLGEFELRSKPVFVDEIVETRVEGDRIREKHMIFKKRSD